LIASEIETEFEAFDSTSLLFLRNVHQLEFQTSVQKLVTLERQETGDGLQQVKLSTSDQVNTWTIVEKNAVALAFVHNDFGICRLEEKIAVVHAFLPTEELSGLGVKVNGDISTDPSRKKVIFDEHTFQVIERIAKLIVDVIIDCLTASNRFDDPISVISALTPSIEPRLLAFKQRSFMKELVSSIQKQVGSSFRQLRCCPNWLNAADFYKFAERSGMWTPMQQVDEIPESSRFLKFLGAADASLDDISAALMDNAPTLLGCVDIVAYLVRNHSTKQIDITRISNEWRIWPTDKSVHSLKEILYEPVALKDEFVDMIIEKISSIRELHRFLNTFTDENIINTLIPARGSNESILNGQRIVEEKPSGVSAQQQSSTKLNQLTPKPLSLKKWRSGEQQVLAILNLQGYQLQDVSRQNVGYDLEGKTPSGEDIFIEVKSIDYPGQPFILTSNEMAVAGEKKEKYMMAIVQQDAAILNLEMIPDPANQLEMTRKCRQWVWECIRYEFSPQTLLLE